MDLHDATRINVRSFVRILHTINTYFQAERRNIDCHIYFSIPKYFSSSNGVPKNLHIKSSNRASWRLGARPNQNEIWKNSPVEIRELSLPLSQKRRDLSLWLGMWSWPSTGDVKLTVNWGFEADRQLGMWSWPSTGDVKLTVNSIHFHSNNAGVQMSIPS
jgi:hypothetical protein